MANTETVAIDGNKLEKILNSNHVTVTSFAKECGISQSYMNNIVRGNRHPSRAVFNVIRLILNVTEEDLLPDKPVEPAVTATQIIADSETKDKIDLLQKTVEALRLDLSNMAKMMIEINKTVKEDKAQNELNAESITALNNRVTDVSSSVAKIYGKLYKKY